MKTIDYIKTFVEETSKIHSGDFINSDFLIMTYGDLVEAIACLPISLQEQFSHKLRQVDLFNGDVAHFFTHAAESLFRGGQ
ncbi:MAG: hypothetical protein FWE48_05385 [Coriobacteriia bacterium]|nr:hypothetical protein [Coriobacteriia bacterium]